MDKSESEALKADASEITALAMRISKAAGSHKLAPGALKNAADQLWPAKVKLGGRYKNFRDAKHWFTVTWSAKLSGSTKASKTPTNGGRTPSGQKVIRNSNGAVIVLLEYERLARLYDTLPADEILADQWGRSCKTVSRVRSKLHQKGFIITKVDGGYKVVERPVMQHSEAAPPPTPSNGDQLVLTIEPPEPVASQNGTDKALLEVLAVLERIERQNATIIEQHATIIDLSKKQVDAWCAGV